MALVNSQSARDRAALTWLGFTRRLEVPFVATRRQMPRTLFLENWVTSRVAARMIAVSGAVSEALVRRGTPRAKIAVVSNGLVAERIDVPFSPEAVESWRGRIGWEPGRRTVGIVSRRKDQAVVLAALEQVQTPVRLILAGVEPDERLHVAIARVPAGTPLPSSLSPPTSVRSTNCWRSTCYPPGWKGSRRRCSRPWRSARRWRLPPPGGTSSW